MELCQKQALVDRRIKIHFLMECIRTIKFRFDLRPEI